MHGLISILVFFLFIIGLPIAVYLLFTRKMGTSQVDFERQKCESPIETRLYDALKNDYLNPITQYPFGKYRIDIAFPNKRLAIECDGKHHLESNQRNHDRRRDKFMRDRGWIVLRYSGKEIYKCLPKIINEINTELFKP